MNKVLHKLRNRTKNRQNTLFKTIARHTKKSTFIHTWYV